MSALRATGGRPILSLATVALAVLLGCSGCSSSSAPARTPTPAPTPLARLNTSAMALPRIDFCTLVPAPAVRHALSRRRGDLTQWGDGDPTAVTGAGRQVVAEHGCAWSAGSAVARAWTYAPPVTRSLARSVVAESRSQEQRQRCRDIDGPPFGQPSLTQLCSDGGVRRIRHAGLFGDTWLTCEVSDDAATRVVRKRADAWCVDVVNTLNLTR